MEDAGPPAPYRKTHEVVLGVSDNMWGYELLRKSLCSLNAFLVIFVKQWFVLHILFLVQDFTNRDFAVTFSKWHKFEHFDALCVVIMSTWRPPRTVWVNQTRGLLLFCSRSRGHPTPPSLRKCDGTCTCTSNWSEWLVWYDGSVMESHGYPIIH